ncbi:hypothetical protein [Legionella parisiensis]|uniref:Uncharacterized protein n=1 Tax=Legionella parisiensis TaxID=45071 RepID=A0A1E5JN65_9GAMM|nr:hypothetical protein [Legionella parisiensis]KTD42852.1 hypothetical protein Lpar_0829 [Legionella parisiensis]OEH45977.1 hypothetical protein lpari_03029 [Legionella parisiensis]STX78074.1 Uncharacterised protein [Legionella parisiensis]
MESKLNIDDRRNRDEEYTSEYTQYPTSYSRTSERPVIIEDKNDENSYFDLFLGNAEQKKEITADLKLKASQSFAYAKENLPGFFTPFKSKKEFGIVATSPLSLPIASALIAGVAVIGSIGTTLTALGSLVFAAGYSLDGLRKGHEESKTKAHDALILAAKAGIVAAVCAAVAVVAALFTAVIFPLALAYGLSRSVATGIVAGTAKVNECMSSCSSEEDHSSSYSHN